MKYMYRIISYFIFLGCILNTYSQELKIKRVSNEKSFFEALGNNTKIIVETDILNFTIANLQENIKVPYIAYNAAIKKEEWVKNTFVIEESGLVLYGYENLSIEGLPSVSNIISNESYEDVLTFRNCKNITLKNLAIEHTVENCTGMVLSLVFTDDIVLENCHLNGSGAVGAYLIGCTNVIIKKSSFFKNAFHAISTINSKKINITDSEIYENSSIFNESPILETHFSQISFKNCNIYQNESDYLYNKKENIDDYFFSLEESEVISYYNERNGLYPNLEITPYIPVFKECDFSYNKFKYKKDTLLRNEKLVPKKKALVTFFTKRLIDALTQKRISYFNGNFYIYELASFFRSKNSTFFEYENNSREDFIKIFYKSDIYLNYDKFDIVNTEVLHNDVIVVSIKASLENKNEKLFELAITVDEDLKIVSLKNMK